MKGAQVKGIDAKVRLKSGEKLDLKGARQAGMEEGFYNLVWAHDNGEVISLRRFNADSIESVEETVVELRPESHLVVPKLQP